MGWKIIVLGRYTLWPTRVRISGIRSGKPQERQFLPAVIGLAGFLVAGLKTRWRLVGTEARVNQPNLQFVALFGRELSGRQAQPFGQNQFPAVAVHRDAGLDEQTVLFEQDAKALYYAPTVVRDIVAAAHFQVIGLFVCEVLCAQELLIEVLHAGDAIIAHCLNS